MADAKGPAFDPIEDLKILALFFTVLWIFWFFNGGPERYKENQKPFLRQPTKFGADESYTYRDPNLNDQYGQIPVIKVTVSNKIPKVEPLIRNPVRVTKLFEKPIIYLSKGQANSLGLSYLKIDFPISNKASFNLTGSSIRDIFGKNVLVPAAAELPYQGRINEESDIIIPPGSIVYLIEAPSPLGVSFRVNKCMGELARFQNFYPLLRPDYAGQAPLDPGTTYNVCVDLHKDEPDFYKNDWRVYLGAKHKTWEETGYFFRLIDSFGNTLSSLFY